MRHEAPKARLSGKWFYFPRNGWTVKAAERLFMMLGRALGRDNEVKAAAMDDFVTIIHLSGERPQIAIIRPEGGEKLVFETGKAKIEVPYDHAYFELYTLLHKRRQRRKMVRQARHNNDSAYKAIYYYWKSWRSLGGGWPFDPPPDGGWPHVPPFF